ncbi:MAG: hypothetical protein V3S01_01400, partial [Dehalococcoidia bacterium]
DQDRFHRHQDQEAAAGAAAVEVVAWPAREDNSVRHWSSSSKCASVTIIRNQQDHYGCAGRHRSTPSRRDS